MVNIQQSVITLNSLYSQSRYLIFWVKMAIYELAFGI